MWVYEFRVFRGGGVDFGGMDLGRRWRGVLGLVLAGVDFEAEVVGCSLLCEFTRWEFWDYLKMRDQRYQRGYQGPSRAVEIFRLRVCQIATRCPVR